jgi:hypothetical protein
MYEKVNNIYTKKTYRKSSRNFQRSWTRDEKASTLETKRGCW